MTYKIKLNYRDDTSEIIEDFDSEDCYDFLLFQKLKKYSEERYNRTDLRSYELIQEVKQCGKK